MQTENFIQYQKKLTRTFNADINGIITDHWKEKSHKPGYHGTFKILSDEKFKHSTATAEWVIEKLLYCFARPGDMVYDCFGGAGTVPYLCNEYGINCRSIEKDNFHYKIMLERIIKSNKNRNFASYAKELMEKINASECGEDNWMGTSLQRSIENREQILEPNTETIKFLDSENIIS